MRASLSRIFVAEAVSMAEITITAVARVSHGHTAYLVIIKNLSEVDDV